MIHVGQVVRRTTFVILTLLTLACGDGCAYKPAATESLTEKLQDDKHVVLYDLGHNNFDDPETFDLFSSYLGRHGYKFKKNNVQFDKGRLALVDIVVIKNAIADVNIERWSLPTPSAFTVKELDTLEDWVREGGGLILVVDHMPVAGAGRDLLSRFGVEISNGFAVKSEALDGYEASDVMKATNLRFCRDDSLDGLINSHPINDGELGSPINLVVTSGGSAFRLPEHGEPLLTFGSGTMSLVPEVSWEFDDETPQIDIKGWMQAGVVRIGHGRVAVLGDSQPLTVPAYFDGPPTADNVDFTLNLFRWISARP